MVIVSACLAGQPCRYNAKAAPNETICLMVQSGEAIPVCPEVLGGLPTPRAAAEIQNGDGGDVLRGVARVLDCVGNDVTEAFLQGAHETLRLCRMYGAQRAILKANSPSCGFGCIYNGTFRDIKREGAGVTAALLSQNGITIEAAPA